MKTYKKLFNRGGVMGRVKTLIGMLVVMLHVSLCAAYEEGGIGSQPPDALYDDNYGVGISHCGTTIDAPKLMLNVCLDNGLIASFTLVYEGMDSELAEQFSEKILNLSGNANILAGVGSSVYGIGHVDLPEKQAPFVIAFPGNNYCCCNLSLDPAFDFSNTPNLKSIEKKTKCLSWLFRHYLYGYEIELSDGTKYQTIEKTKEWDFPMKIDQRVILIGSKKCLSLINVDAVQAKEVATIEKDGSDYFVGLIPVND